MGDERKQMKEQAARAALAYIPSNGVVGIGTGSTVNCLIAQLSEVKSRIKAVVSSSEASSNLLRSIGLEVIDFNDCHELDVYIDGADAYNELRELVKGGGGALTREKILASASKQFVCMVDATKKPGILGDFPVPVEVLPMARSFVARELVKLGGQPEYRQGFVTDNQNVILDVHGWQITEPIKLEQQINHIPGVVENGIFASRPADIILVGYKDKSEIFTGKFAHS